MQWPSFSIPRVRALGRSPNAVIPLDRGAIETRCHHESALADEGSAFGRLFRISTCKKLATNAPEINTSKTKDFKSTAMNTCKKMGEGVGSAYLRRFPQ